MPKVQAGKETVKLLAIFDHTSTPRCAHPFVACANFQPATASGPNIPCLTSSSLLSKAMLKLFALLLLPAALASAADAPATKYVRMPPEGIPVPTEIKSE